jgi:hypothetical protein
MGLVFAIVWLGYVYGDLLQPNLLTRSPETQTLTVWRESDILQTGILLHVPGSWAQRLGMIREGSGRVVYRWVHST